MAKRMSEQMELFEPVERGFNEGGDTSSAKDTAMQDLQSSAADKKATRQDQFDKLTDMLMSGEIKDMPEEKQKKFINLYKMMKSQGFNEGGLMDEGGMVDEESGNEVPPGSLREEVRDDIPAQLSEGEFVFPADVVRYIGLENLMRMRQEAKQGLSQMKAMGQMGNSEEATVQDNLPFDMYDLDVDEEEEYNMAVGGYVAPFIPSSQQQPYNQPTQVNPQTGTYTLPGTGIAGYQVPSGGQTGYTPYGGAAPYFQPVQFTGPQFQTALQTTNLPTFAETIGQRPGQYDELRTYINDAGQTMQIPFKDGKPIYPIPEGYRPIEDQPEPEEEVFLQFKRIFTEVSRSAGQDFEETAQDTATMLLSEADNLLVDPTDPTGAARLNPRYQAIAGNILRDILGERIKTMRQLSSGKYKTVEGETVESTKYQTIVADHMLEYDQDFLSKFETRLKDAISEDKKQEATKAVVTAKPQQYVEGQSKSFIDPSKVVSEEAAMFDTNVFNVEMQLRENNIEKAFEEAPNLEKPTLADISSGHYKSKVSQLLETIESSSKLKEEKESFDSDSQLNR